MNSNTQTHKSIFAQVVFRCVFAAVMTLTLMGTTRVATANVEAPEAMPIVGGTSYGTAVAISPGIEYSGILTGTTRPKDFFSFTVNPGAIVTLTFTSGVTWTSTAYFYLDDQDHTSYLTYVGNTGPEQTKQIVYIGKSTTPTKYYVRAEISGSSVTNIDNYAFKLEMEDQADSGQAYDAGEAATSPRVITPTLGTTTTYTGTVGGADTNDWFRIAAVSGQIISVSVSMDDYGPTPATSYFYIYDEANSSSYFQYVTFSSPDKTPKLLSYVSNNTKPAGYLLRMERSSTLVSAAHYQFTVTSGQQADGKQAGDAGEDFTTARLISPTLDATSNLLGSADKVDFYQTDLPIDPVTGANANVPFKILVSPVEWPAGSGGYLAISKYDSTRKLVGSTQYIQAPTTEALSIDLTNCDLCYVKVEDQTSGTKQFAYSFKLLKPFSIYMPVVNK